MNRIQLACFSLIASAFVLTALLVIQAQNRQVALNQQAEASLVLARDTFTVMTAPTKKDEEALFVLDNQTQRLMIFKLDESKRTIRLIKDGVVNLTAVFKTGGEEKGEPKGGNRMSR